MVLNVSQNVGDTDVYASDAFKRIVVVYTLTDRRDKTCKNGKGKGNEVKVIR